LEVLNFGVPGYGLGQSYLRYLKDGLKFSPDIIFFNYLLLSDRDRISPNEWASSSNIRVAHLYRVRFRIENDVLLSQATTPYDLFDPSFRKKYLFQPLGIDSHARFGSWKIFSISNTGLALKQLAYNRSLSKNTSQTKYHDEEINDKILEHLLLTAEQNKSTFIFFYDRAFSDLPQRIQSLLKEHASRVIYVNAQKALQERYAAHGKDKVPCKRFLCAPEDLINASGHFNAQGNRIFAEAVLEILKKNPWGENDRKFQFDEQSRTFHNTTLKQ